MSKNKEIQEFLDNMSSDFFGKKRSEVIESKNECVMCDEPDMNFRDELSKKEFKISGMCQTCQDAFYGEHDL